MSADSAGRSSGQTGRENTPRFSSLLFFVGAGRVAAWEAPALPWLLGGAVATWDDVRRLVAAMPDTDEHASYGGLPSWRVHRKGFAWERPLRGADRAALGGAAPAEIEPVLGVLVADEGVKAALIADEPDVFFTTPHFDGYPAVLVRLERIPVPELAELVEDGWRARAPKRLLTEFAGRRDASATEKDS